MEWEIVTAGEDLFILERVHKGYVTRIEARLEDEKWMVYNTYFNEKGLNVNEEFEARSKEEAQKIIQVLKKQPAVSLKTLTGRMMEQKKKMDLSIQRSYKEYNVEKWFFGINKDKPVNFVVLRYYDSVELDFVIHERYRVIEQKIIKTIVQSLGLNDLEEDLDINCYYFNRHTQSTRESEKKNVVLGKLEFGFD